MRIDVPKEIYQQSTTGTWPVHKFMFINFKLQVIFVVLIHTHKSRKEYMSTNQPTNKQRFIHLLIGITQPTHENDSTHQETFLPQLVTLRVWAIRNFACNLVAQPDTTSQESSCPICGSHNMYLMSRSRLFFGFGLTSITPARAGSATAEHACDKHLSTALPLASTIHLANKTPNTTPECATCGCFWLCICASNGIYVFAMLYIQQLYIQQLCKRPSASSACWATLGW